MLSLNLAKGGMKIIRVPLNLRLIASIRENYTHRALSLYWDAAERITPVARFVMLFCLEQGVPVGALSRYIGVSHSTVHRLRRKRKQAGDIAHRDALLELLERLAFEGGGGSRRVPGGM